MNKIQKWIVNWDSLTLVLGGLLVYFAESIVTILYPLDPPPVDTISILYYLVCFAIATFWILKSVAYITIKISWSAMYEYLENELDNDIKQLTPWQRVLTSLFFYLSLAFLLAIIFSAVVGVM